MPPPAPGFRRSRALWDEARRPNARRFALVRAILYELQPVRFSAIDVSAIRDALRSVWTSSVSFVTETVPWLTHGSSRLIRNMNRNHWMGIGCFVLYCVVVRWVHRLLDAGPLLVIVTALVAIFTIGLGDTATQDGMSAYSVFNRGFERILGTVDAEALVQQHVGGGMGLAAAAGAGVAAGAHHREPNDRVEDVQNEPVARGREERHDDEDSDEDNEEGQRVPADRGTSRKSGKKARRRNLEERRELQRQRQLAMAMGFTGEEGEEEMVAMQRLLEEEIAANNGQRE